MLVVLFIINKYQKNFTDFKFVKSKLKLLIFIIVLL